MVQPLELVDLRTSTTKDSTSSETLVCHSLRSSKSKSEWFKLYEYSVGLLLPLNRYMISDQVGRSGKEPLK